MATATVWLNPNHDAVYHLPRVCMKCGAEAITVREREFSAYPSWILWLLLAGPIPFALAGIVTTKRQRVQAPFCNKHKNHWAFRTWAAVIGTFILLGSGVGAVMLMTPNLPQHGGSGVYGYICMGWFVLLHIWVVGLILFNFLTTIRATEITHRLIILTHVAPEFNRALRKEEEDANEREINRELAAGWREQNHSANHLDDDGIERPDD